MSAAVKAASCRRKRFHYIMHKERSVHQDNYECCSRALGSECVSFSVCNKFFLSDFYYGLVECFGIEWISECIRNICARFLLAIDSILCIHHVNKSDRCFSHCVQYTAMYAAVAEKGHCLKLRLVQNKPNHFAAKQLSLNQEHANLFFFTASNVFHQNANHLLRNSSKSHSN